MNQTTSYTFSHIKDTSSSSINLSEQNIGHKAQTLQDESKLFPTEPQLYQEDNESSIGDLVNLSYRKCFTKTIFSPHNQYKFEPAQKEAESNKILSCRFDPFGSFIASGCEDGVIRIVSNLTNSLAYNLLDESERACAVTCVRWRPTNPQDNLKFTLMASYSNGCVLLWHTTSNQILVRVKEEENPLNCCDFSCDGLRFVTAGQDTNIRLYDAGKAKPIATHTEAGIDAPKHSNRIFALKHHQTEPFTLYSAGWDNTVLVWDLRAKQAQQYIYGPLVCGDALDQHGHHLLTGSWRDDNQLEIWDLRMLSKVVAIKQKYNFDYRWDNFASPKVDPTFAQHFRQRSAVYSACFDKNGKNIYAGSAGTLFSEVRVFDPEDNYRCQDAYSGIPRGVLSIDCTGKSKQMLAYGVADGTLGLMNLNL